MSSQGRQGTQLRLPPLNNEKQGGQMRAKMLGKNATV
jgi:hypothetical protein